MKQCFLKNNKFVGGLFSSLHSSLFFETGQCKSAPTYVNAFLQELTGTVNSPQSSILCVLCFKSVEEPRDSAPLNEQLPLSGLSYKNEYAAYIDCVFKAVTAHTCDVSAEASAALPTNSGNEVVFLIC